MNTSVTSPLADRDLRQRQIIPPERLATCRATVVGVGAIGRQAALQLAAIGVPELQLIDHDTVEAVNLAPQGYMEEDLGQPKVSATAELCRRLNTAVKIQPMAERFRRSTQELGNVLLCCVDSIETRRLIWEAVKSRVELFIDARMSAEVLRVLAVGDAAGREHYPTTLFTAGEAFVGACTARGTVYCANIAAGLMVSQLARWLRRLPVDRDVTLNLLAMEMSLPYSALEAQDG